MYKRQPQEGALAVIARAEEKGARVYALSGKDVSQEQDVQALLATRFDQPMRGIFHAAGVLNDKFIADLDAEGLRSVVGPKVEGTMYLHKHSQGLPLDHFVLFSSITSVTGNAGQANYAAANAFMDGLVESRVRNGLPGNTINWGPWAEAGMAS